MMIGDLLPLILLAEKMLQLNTDYFI